MINNKTANVYNVANFQTVKYGNEVGSDIKLLFIIHYVPR